jgi:hypothetical protein
VNDLVSPEERLEQAKQTIGKLRTALREAVAADASAQIEAIYPGWRNRVAESLREAEDWA